MKFNNIKQFEQRMDDAGINIAFFTIQYQNCVIEAVYSKAQRKFLLAIVDHNIGFTCSLENEYASAYINHEKATKQLMECRNHYEFDPKHFFEYLDNQLPRTTLAQVTNKQYENTARNAVSNFEDRIFFNHWRDSNMSKQQRDKTIELMGYEVIEFCDENHLIPIFYPHPTDRTLAVLENFEHDYDVHNAVN